MSKYYGMRLKSKNNLGKNYNVNSTQEHKGNHVDIMSNNGSF